MAPHSERSNDNPASRAIKLTEDERKIVKIAKEEAVKQIERKYKLAALIPFLMKLKADYDFKKLMWQKIHDILGIEKKARSKLLLLTLLLLLLTLIIGPEHTLSIVLRWLGENR